MLVFFFKADYIKRNMLSLEEQLVRIFKIHICKRNSFA